MSNYYTPKVPPDWVLEKIRECLNYNLETGVLTWVKCYANNVRLGDAAGSQTAYGYLQVFFRRGKERREVKNHHICWFLHYGEWPTRQLDHKDTNRSNNRIENLRLSTQQQNCCNIKKPSNNTSGHKGIYFNKRSGKWRVQVMKNGRKMHIGYYPSLNDAIVARDAAYEYHHGEFARID